MIGRTVSHFKVNERLDRGGMGVVYVGEDLSLGRPVALKFLPPHLSSDETAKKRFIREAKAASSLNHPHICTIYEVGETDDDQLFIAMALYEGQTLKARLEHEEVSMEQAVLIAAQVADGLAKAHEKGILHRDIKPANVFMTDHGEAVILDFGLAKLSGAVELTAVGKTLGTAAYMSPEQMRGEEVGPATDVWSLGVMLYEMLAGKRPFAGDYEQALAYGILNMDPPPLEASAHLPEGVIAVVNRCLEKDTGDRYESATQVRDELRRYLPGSAHFSSADATFRRATGVLSTLRSPRRWIPLAAVATVLVVAALLWVRLFVFRGDTQRIVVLPFTLIGADQEGQHIAAGLLETLTSGLSGLKLTSGTIGVIPASEVTARMTTSEARKRLGATMTVEGNVQFQDGRKRLTLSIVDARTLLQIDSRQADFDQTGSLALQDQAIDLVREMLRLELDPAAVERIRSWSSSNADANDFYLRARGRLRGGWSLERVDGAISLFELAVAQDSMFAVALAGLGDAYWAKYRWTKDVQWADKAIEFSNRALQLDDSQGIVYLTLGTIYRDRGMFREAMNAFDRAQKLNPTDPEIYLQRGDAWRLYDRPDLAEKNYRIAIELNPGYWRGHAYLGSLFYRRDQYQRAIAEWRRGLDVAPENPDLLSNVGAAYWALAQPDKAVVSFESALRSHPDHPRAKQNLGTAYFYMRQYARAASFYEDKIKATPKDATAVTNLADTYYWMPGRRQDADSLYRVSITLTREQLKIRGDAPVLLGDLAYSYAACGKPDSAARFIEQAVSNLDPDSSEASTVFGIGETYERMGRRDEAVLWMSKALDRDLNRIRLRHSPFLAEIRKDPRMKPYLVEKAS